MFCRWLAVMRRRAVVALLLAWAAPAQTLQLGGPRPSRRSLQCVSPVPATMRFDDAAAFEAEVRAYVSTLDEQAMHDPAAPSPLAYAELQRNGRVDLVEGCMEHGGYIQVSKRLGVPLRLAKPADLSSDAPPRFSEPLPPTIGLKLSGSKREADMAASVQALDLAGAATAAAPAVGNGGVVYEPTPLQLPKIETAGSVSVPRWELAWLFRYDGAQRAGLVFFAWLSGAAYGRATAELLEPSVASALQAAAQVSSSSICPCPFRRSSCGQASSAPSPYTPQIR